MRIGKRQWNVKYWAYFTGTEDDVEYVFQEEYDRPVGFDKTQGEWYNNHLNILTWNVFMRYDLAEYQTGRGKMVGPKVPGYDVIAFNEVFDHDGEATLRESLRKAGYPNQTKVLGRGRSISKGIWNGGVMIASPYPIADTDEVFYDQVCEGEDCNADKGALYAKIDKSKKKGVHNYFHIFATHMNQGSQDWSYQERQLNMIAGLIQKQNIPQNEAIIVLGDMNINKCVEFEPGPLTIDPVPKGPVHQCKTFNPKYEFMLDILGATDVDHKGYRYSHDGNINGFNNWEYEATLRPIHKGDLGNLDHILIVNNGRKPTKASYTETRVLRNDDEWKKLETDLARWDISDHFAVYGNLHFEYNPLWDWDPGVDTVQLTRYYNGQEKDFVAVATTNEHNTVKQEGYERVGDHGLLFKTKKAADQWSKSAPPQSGKKQVSLASKPGGKGSKPRRSLSRIRSRGIPEGGQGSGGIVGELIEESEFSDNPPDVVELDEKDLDALEEIYAEVEEGDEGHDVAMEPGVEGSGEIVERGIRKKSKPRRFTLRPVRKGSGGRMVKSEGKPFQLTLLPIVPLNLYYSDTYKDYLSTTSFVRGKQAMQGAGKYQHKGVQGYVFSNTMYRKLPNSLRSRMIPMTSWYSRKTRDNLIATSPGDRQHAKQNGYKQVALEGYLIIPPPPKVCKVKADCPSSHFCDTKQGVCRPDIH
jgi:endonuclease/exonuclease/phosphatase family metal-dependent hydrolase